MAEKQLTHDQKIALEYLYNGKGFSWSTSANVKRARGQLVRRGLAVKLSEGHYSLTSAGRELGREYRYYDWNPEIAAFALELEAARAEIDAVCSGVISIVAKQIGYELPKKAANDA
jgi:hypothetical protein